MGKASQIIEGVRNVLGKGKELVGKGVEHVKANKLPYALGAGGVAAGAGTVAALHSKEAAYRAGVQSVLQKYAGLLDKGLLMDLRHGKLPMHYAPAAARGPLKTQLEIASTKGTPVAHSAPTAASAPAAASAPMYATRGGEAPASSAASEPKGKGFAARHWKPLAAGVAAGGVGGYAFGKDKAAAAKDEDSHKGRNAVAAGTLAIGGGLLLRALLKGKGKTDFNKAIAKTPVTGGNYKA